MPCCCLELFGVCSMPNEVVWLVSFLAGQERERERETDREREEALRGAFGHTGDEGTAQTT